MAMAFSLSVQLVGLSTRLTRRLLGSCHKVPVALRASISRRRASRRMSSGLCFVTVRLIAAASRLSRARPVREQTVTHPVSTCSCAPTTVHTSCHDSRPPRSSSYSKPS